MNDPRTEVDALVDHLPVPFTEDQENPGVIVVPPGWQTVDYDPERWADRPRRRRGTVRLRDAGSFVTYVELFGADPVVYVDDDRRNIVAVLNDHGESAAGWRDHRAVLEPRPDRAWERWVALSGQWATQEVLAEVIETHLDTVVDPDAATMLELATTFEATERAEFQSGVVLQSGARQLVYRQTVEARGGGAGELEIPAKVVLSLSPFEGVAQREIDARFRYRIREGKLALALILDGTEDVLDEVFAEFANEISACLVGVPTLYGVA